jgi:hypothetical protein
MKSPKEQFKERQIVRKTIGIKVENMQESLAEIDRDLVGEDEMKLYRINVEESETMKVQRVKYWQRRMRTVRAWGMLIIFTQMGYQTKYLFAPTTPG